MHANRELHSEALGESSAYYAVAKAAENQIVSSCAAKATGDNVARTSLDDAPSFDNHKGIANLEDKFV